MGDMERKCKNVLTWDGHSKINRPTCSENCFRAIFQLARNTIGEMWSDCDCRLPKTKGSLLSLSQNSAFEEQCFHHQRNRRTFCYHEYSCKGKGTGM